MFSTTKLLLSLPRAVLGEFGPALAMAATIAVVGSAVAWLARYGGHPWGGSGAGILLTVASNALGINRVEVDRAGVRSKGWNCTQGGQGS